MPKASRKDEDQYRQFVDDANSIILRMDASGRIIFFNKFAEKFFGYKAGEVLGKSVIGTIVPSTDSSGRDLRAMIRDIMCNPNRYIHNENENMLRSGQRVWIAWSNKAVAGNDKRKKEVLCVGNDISEIKRAQELLKEMDNRKSAFVANVSHEFKNPLGTIREVLAHLLEEASGKINEGQASLLKIAQNNTLRLMRLVSDLLDLSKIEAGKMKLKSKKMEIGPLVDEIITSSGIEIAKKKLTVRKDIPRNIGSVRADKDKLTQVIINLLSNAIKYTPDRGRIYIKLRGSPKEIRFKISDTGPGIAKKDFKKMFDKFERLTAERQEGTGLGLAIAKDIVELHKGKIWVESDLGKGTSFIFSLPRNLGGGV